MSKHKRTAEEIAAEKEAYALRKAGKEPPHMVKYFKPQTVAVRNCAGWAKPKGRYIKPENRY